MKQYFWNITKIFWPWSDVLGEYEEDGPYDTANEAFEAGIKVLDEYDEDFAVEVTEWKDNGHGGTSVSSYLGPYAVKHDGVITRYKDVNDFTYASNIITHQRFLLDENN